jgi:hypothetical protein
MKKIFFAFVALFITASALNAQVSEIFVKDGYAIGGYDPVAFFTENKAIKGAEGISITWKNAKWLFSNKKHADMFKANPEKYAPQYGGYCAYGCSRGYKAKTEIEAFTVTDGKLYFNYNIKTRAEWTKDMKAYIEKADAEWEKMQHKNPEN